jgi:CPA2 family monovalent cation:H+ antiporter-2
MGPLISYNFLEDMALVLCVAALATVICQLLRQPLLLGYLVAGMVVGPNVPGVYANTERVHLVSELGVTVLVFAIGLEFDLRRLIRLAPTAGLVALIQFAAMVGLGYLVGHLMGWTPWESLLTGAILSIYGVVIIAKAFEEARVDPRVRELVFGVVLCEDVIAILLLAVLITIANGGAVSFRAFSIDAGLLSTFIIALVAIGLITVPYVVRGVAGFKRPETLLITGLGLCFAFAMIAERAGYSLVLGAFLAGVLVAESGHGAEVEKLIGPIRHVFGAIFFVAVGMLIDPQLLARYWPVLAVLVAVVVAGKIVSVFNRNWRASRYRAQNRVRNGTDRCVLIPNRRGGLARKRHAQLPLHVGSRGLGHDRVPVPIADSRVHAGSGLARSPPSPAGPEYAFSI